MNKIFRLFACLRAALLLLTALCNDSWAQTVSLGSPQIRIADVIWGFDGRVSAGHFQPLSLLVDNLSGDVIEGTISIRLTTGFSREGSAALQQPLYLSGQSRRWVQFYPYVTDVSDSWTVELQTENGKFELQSLDPPRVAADAAWNRLRQGSAGVMSDPEENLPAVFLDPPRKQDRQPTTVRHMPAEIFPPYSTAIGGLHAVFLDHVPDWEEPREQAFLTWLQRGGQLYLMLDDNRRELVFQGPLSVLNQPQPEFRVGSGMVRREDVQRQDLTEARVNAVVRRSLNADADEELLDINDPAAALGRMNLLNDDDLFVYLRDKVEPKHAWTLIGLLSFAYIFALYPGIWRFSNNNRFHPFKTIAAVLGLSALFSLFFLWLGRRGYGETESLQTLMVASAEDQRHWNCLQFTQLFATDGGTYQLTDQNHQTLLVSGNRFDRSDSVIQHGNAASMTSRLAPYSTEVLTMARRLELPDWNVQINRQQLLGNTLATLELSLGPEFPFAEDTLCLAIVGKKVWELSLDQQQGKAVIGNSSPMSLNELLWRDNDTYTLWWSPPTTAEAPAQTEDPHRQRRMLLIRRALAQRSLIASQLRIEPGTVLLLVEAAMPEEFRLQCSPEVTETGRVLFMKMLSLTPAAPL